MYVQEATRIYTILKDGRFLKTVRVPITDNEDKNKKKAIEEARIEDTTGISVSR